MGFNAFDEGNHPNLLVAEALFAFYRHLYERKKNFNEKLETKKKETQEKKSKGKKKNQKKRAKKNVAINEINYSA